MEIDPSLRLLIGELGARMGLGDLALDTDGAASLRFDGKAVVNFQLRPNEDVLVLYSDLGVPANGPELYADLLRGNLFWRTTLGATLSLSGDEPPHVILALQVPWRGLDGARLAARMETFVKTIEDWSELVAERVLPERTDTGLDTSSNFGMMIRA